MRKMISVLLAGVLAVNLGACSSAASKASKKQNLLLRQEPRLRKVVESVLCV